MVIQTADTLVHTTDSHGVANRGASARVGRETEKGGTGYFERQEACFKHGSLCCYFYECRNNHSVEAMRPTAIFCALWIICILDRWSHLDELLLFKSEAWLWASWHLENNHLYWYQDLSMHRSADLAFIHHCSTHC